MAEYIFEKGKDDVIERTYRLKAKEFEDHRSSELSTLPLGLWKT